MENKREIMAKIVALLSQLIENESDTQKEKPPERSAVPVEMLTIKDVHRLSAVCLNTPSVSLLHSIRYHT